MDALSVIKQFYAPDSELYEILVNHSRVVANIGLRIAKSLPSALKPDLAFIETAAMLHDIGIFQTRALSIGCSGEEPYIRHGVLGRKLLDGIGLPRAYGLVCEHHTGAGISKANIIQNNLPLPQKDMIPVRLEEKIICIADKYHSKSRKLSGPQTTTDQVVKNLSRIDPSHGRRFEKWAEEFHLWEIMG